MSLLTAQAVRKGFAPVRINYECLGNTLAHIHWHVIPRFEWDPQPESPIWVRSKEERNIGVEPERLAFLLDKMRSRVL